MEKKPDLRQFQASLDARLREVAGEPASTSRIGLQSGGRHWLLKLDDAGEIVPVPDLTPVPLTKPWFLGLANVRGTLVGVVDFSLFAGGPPTPRAADARIVLAPDRLHVRSGVLVERMLGLRAVERMQVDPAQNEAPSRMPWMGGDLRDGEGKRWTQLDMQALVTSNEYLQVSA